MERADRILSDRVWRECAARIDELERGRPFCRHGAEHMLDVARLAWIDRLERGEDVGKELIYAAAMTHDIGRHVQYLDGVPHEIAGAEIAEGILTACGFNVAERAEITNAIRLHRDPGSAARDGLAGLIYRADKRSRACFLCAASDDCDWGPEKKNLTLTV